jgi:hypothetical protein
MYLFSAGPVPKPKGQESIAQGWYLFSVISQSSSPFVLRARSLVVAGKRAERRGRARYEGSEEPAGGVESIQYTSYGSPLEGSSLYNTQTTPCNRSCGGQSRGPSFACGRVGYGGRAGRCEGGKSGVPAVAISAASAGTSADLGSRVRR